jgi:hypothetical protein
LLPLNLSKLNPQSDLLRVGLAPHAACEQASLMNNFGLKNCPFGPSIKNYTKVFEKLPEGFADFSAEFNKPSHVTDQYKVGEGAGLSPFCSVHQPMRSAFEEKIKIGGRSGSCSSGASPVRARKDLRRNGLRKAVWPKRSWTGSSTTTCATTFDCYQFASVIGSRIVKKLLHPHGNNI